MMAQKILFLHGFFASGACVPALALKDYFNGKATVLTPDLPLYPREALDFIRKLCEQEKPDILVGNSNGSFLAQIVGAQNKIPALLGNPYFEMTRFLIERTNLPGFNSISGIIARQPVRKTFGVYLERTITWRTLSLYS